MSNNFNNIIAETEALIAQTGIGITEFTKEEIWLKKRVGKITASNCPDLMTKGTKGVEWGKTALNEMYTVKYERRTGLSRESFSNSNFDWGHENEPNAIDWLRDQMMNQVLSCSNDFNDIIFQEPFNGFGDSPDGFIYDFERNIEGVLEIKCPVDVAKIERFYESIEITPKDDYYWQFIAHLIGTPEAKYIMYLVYDGYSNTGVFTKLNRCDCLDDIQLLTNRIKLANHYIDESLRLNIPLQDLVKIG